MHRHQSTLQCVSVWAITGAVRYVVWTKVYVRSVAGTTGADSVSLTFQTCTGILLVVVAWHDGYVPRFQKKKLTGNGK